MSGSGSGSDGGRRRSVRALVLLGACPLMVTLGVAFAVSLRGARQGVVFLGSWTLFAVLVAAVVRAAPLAARDVPKTTRGLVTSFHEYIRFHSEASRLDGRRTEAVILVLWLFPIAIFALFCINAVWGILGSIVSQ